MIWIVYAESVVWKARTKVKAKMKWRKKGKVKVKTRMKWMKRKIERLVSYTVLSFYA